MTVEILSEAQTSKVSATVPPITHLLILDASGSMGWATDPLTKDLEPRIRAIKPGDSVAIGWFSGSRSFKWIATGRLDSEKEYNTIIAAVKREYYGRGSTRFDEILADTPARIADLGNNVVKLVFMSDGCQNDGSRQDTLQAALKIKPLLTASAVVAYGDYADRSFLGDIARTLGGELVTASRTEQIAETVGRVSVGNTVKRRRVRVPSDVGIAFSLGNDGTVIVLTNEAYQDVAEDAAVYAIKGNGKTQITDERALYAGAFALVQLGKVDDAIELLGNLGDKHIVDLLANAITVTEFATAETALVEAVRNPKARFVGGRKIGCAPNANAFDVLDLLNLLKDDKDSYFFPYHPDFDYKRIGRKSKPARDYPKFNADKNTGVPLNRIVSHAKELNIGIGVTIGGTVFLPETVTALDGVDYNCHDVGLTSTFNTRITRTYSIISNGKPNVTSLPASVSAVTYQELQREGLIDLDELWEPGKVFVLDLTKIPACKRARGASPKFEQICRNEVESIKIGNVLKVLNAKLKELDPDGDRHATTQHGAEALKFLEACGINNRLEYNPDTIKEDATDFLEGNTFEVKVAKTSSVSMKDFQEMVNGKKKFNAVGLMMQVGQDDLKALPINKLEAIKWLSDRIALLKADQAKLDIATAAERYSIAVSGAWPKFHKGDSANYTIDGFECTLEFKPFKKPI